MNDGAFIEQRSKPEPEEKLEGKWKEFDFTNAVGLLLLMKEIQEQEPLDDPNILMITEDGTALY